MRHEKQAQVDMLINHKIPVLLEGPSGSGKTTILMNAAKEAGIPYSFISGTRQTTVSHIIGFMNVNGVYSPSPFRKAYEEGHYFNVDEIDAMDSNVLLIFNSLENHIMYFPDGYSEPPHKNFRFMATANPQDQHDRYVGRNKLDAATLDRFDQVSVDRDPALEESLVDSDTIESVGILRKALRQTNSSITISMRDSIRFQKRKDLKLLTGFVEKMVGGSELVLEKYQELLDSRPKNTKTQDCKSLNTLDALMSKRLAEKEKPDGNKEL